MSAVKFALTSGHEKKDFLDENEKSVVEENASTKNKENNDENEDKSSSGLMSMSPLRKTMFLFSILVSIVSCCVFLWAIPCDMATCTAPAHMSSHSNNGLNDTTSTIAAYITQSQQATS